MSLSAFDNLRATHPDRLDAITAIERHITRTLRRDPHAVIDDAILWQQIREDRVRADLELTRRLLVELETLHALQRRLFWLCPIGLGTAFEAADADEFPTEIECERCGREHALRAADVEVKFTPSEALLREVHGAPPQQ
jgi:hypothetical protein